MKYRAILALTIIVVVFAFPVKTVDSSYAINDYQARYSVMGKIILDESQYAVNTYATITFSAIGDNSNISITYENPFISGDMPYDLPVSIFILTNAEMKSNTYNGVKMSNNTEMNPFYETYGLEYRYANLDNPSATYECKWEKYSGVLLELSIDAKNTNYEHLTYRCVSTSFDMYSSYSSTYVNQVNVIKAFMSPAGFLILLTAILLAFIGIAMLNRSKKKSSAPTREARVTK